MTHGIQTRRGSVPRLAALAAIGVTVALVATTGPSGRPPERGPPAQPPPPRAHTGVDPSAKAAEHLDMTDEVSIHQDRATPGTVS